MEQYSFRKISHHWGALLKDKKFRTSLIIGFLVLFLALYVNYVATLATSDFPVLSVRDLILDHIPTLDLSFLYIWGQLFVILLVILYPVLMRPEVAPFTLKTISAFILIRSFFILLTHLGVPEAFYKIPQISFDAPFARLFYLNDLFFSGHTGLPFLASLLFWENRFMRYFFLLISVVMAATVLLMHVHYSIDVFAAYFITYSIYKVSDEVFNKLNVHYHRVIEKWEREERLIGRVIRRIRKVKENVKEKMKKF